MADEQDADVPVRGVFWTAGSEFTLHGVRVARGPDGPTVFHEGISLRQDVCAHWLRIAIAHCLQAGEANRDLKCAADDEISTQLGREFHAAMQAMVASAVAIDALYGAVVARQPVDAATRQRWQDNRTARWRQQREVFRRSFGLSSGGVQKLKPVLRDMSRYRGWAVHPPSEQKSPVVHPDLHRAIEWRFVAFRYTNAVEFVRSSLAVVNQLTTLGRDIPELKAYCGYLHAEVLELIDQWHAAVPNAPATREYEKSQEGMKRSN